MPALLLLPLLPPVALLLLRPPPLLVLQSLLLLLRPPALLSVQLLLASALLQDLSPLSQLMLSSSPSLLLVPLLLLLPLLLLPLRDPVIDLPLVPFLPTANPFLSGLLLLCLIRPESWICWLELLVAAGRSTITFKMSSYKHTETMLALTSTPL